MRRDAAGDENAALGIEAECKVAGKPARSAQKASSAARLTGQLPAMPARVMAAALRSGTVRNSAKAIA